MNDLVGLLAAGRRWGVTLAPARGCVLVRGARDDDSEGRGRARDGAHVDRALVLAEVVRGYLRAHGLGGTREMDVGDFADEHGPDGVRGVHPHEHRRSAETCRGHAAPKPHDSFGTPRIEGGGGRRW
jgi:hypothetical protein